MWIQNKECFVVCQKVRKPSIKYKVLSKEHRGQPQWPNLEQIKLNEKINKMMIRLYFNTENKILIIPYCYK